MCRKTTTINDGWCAISCLFSHEYGLNVWQYTSFFCGFHDYSMGHYRFLSLHLDLDKDFWTLQKLSLNAKTPLHVKAHFNALFAKMRLN